MSNSAIPVLSQNELPDIRDALPLGPDDEPLMVDLYQVLKKYSALKRFGITLLHKHFDLASRPLRALAAAGLLASAAAAQAAVITVNSLADGAPYGECTLRGAILSANLDGSVGGCVAGSGTDKIVFGVRGTITLTQGQLDITSALVVEGPGSDDLIISGNDSTRVFEVSGAGFATISRVSIVNGNSSNGGAVAVREGNTLTLSRCLLRGNTSSGNGGGIWSFGNLTISNCTLRNNSASINNGGGGIISGGTLVVAGSILHNNAAGVGGGIHNLGIAMIVDSDVKRNTATFSGGGIQNTAVGNLIAAGSRIEKNTASSGGGISNHGLVELADTVVAGNAPDDCVGCP